MTTRTIIPPETPFDLKVVPPGSKSHTIRALFLAALATGRSTIGGGLVSDDTGHARNCLRQLGVEIHDSGPVWDVVGRSGVLGPSSDSLNVGESGLTARFVLSVGRLARGTTRVVGSGRLPDRPMGGLLGALAASGADVETTYPWAVRGEGVFEGGKIAIDGSVTSQGVSALLMISPMAMKSTSIEVVGRATSTGYVEMTLDMMGLFGAEVENLETGWVVAPGGYLGTHVDVPIDASALVYPAAAAAITGGAVTIVGHPGRHPDLEFLIAIEEMGCQVSRSVDEIRVVGPESLVGIERDMSMAPDSAVALSVLCSVARGPSRISGLGSLRHKESDRLAALHTELSKIGADLTIEGETLLITPGRPATTAQVLESHNDHRLAMSFALLGLVDSGISVRESEAVSKTWPDFWEWLENTGARVLEVER